MSFAEYEFVSYMNKFNEPPFDLSIGNHKHHIGNGVAAFSVQFDQIPALSDLLTSTSIALGESYMNGNLKIQGDLYQVLNLFLHQINKFTTNQKKLKQIFRTSVSKSSQKKEVSSHYDIGNDFYKLWLDPTLSYSCGYFPDETTTLFEAQCNKVDRILEKLYLKEGMTLCDIGCGWGFLLLRAAKKYNIHGVGITLSKEQKKAFEEKIKEEHVEDLLEVKLMDYRDLPHYKKRFDRVVSVGMLEHVGRKNYKKFLNCAKSIIKPGGLLLLHYISSLTENSGDAWIKKYIFPGGVIPSLREILAISAELNYYTLDIESLRRHYTKTLLCWNKNFQEHRSEVVSMFDEKFAKMWELYLCSCAATFENGITDLHQIVFSNGLNNDLPMTRWY